MNKKCSLIKSLMKGDVIHVSNSIHLTGYSNPSREVKREIEDPFGVKITRTKIETKDQWGNYAMYYTYKLEYNQQNAEGISKMAKYLLENNAVEKTGQKISREKISFTHENY